MNRCNLRCSHCYQGGYLYEELPWEKLIIIADQITAVLRKWNMLGRISLTGGEPFLSSHLFSLLDYFEKSLEIKQVDILTNGTCITQNHMEILKNFRKLHQIQISIDGPIAEVHDAVRGSGTFGKVKETIRRLRENQFDVSLMFTLMRKNMDYAIQLIDFAEECGVNAVTVERVTPCGHSSLTDMLTAEEVETIYEGITKRANGVRPSLTVRRLRPLWINTAHLNTTANSKIGGFCPVGFTSLAILWDGTVLPCRRLGIPIGNVLTDGLFKIWYDSDVLWNIRNKENLKGKCHGCHNIERCGGCRAIAYETSGDYMGEDIQCWI
ncbi:radical SAM/SPASM domain-containing protein [Bilophila wadsworthia]|nr:radical SAM protein [Bilophila wadsworthia]